MNQMTKTMISTQWTVFDFTLLCAPNLLQHAAWWQHKGTSESIFNHLLCALILINNRWTLTHKNMNIIIWQHRLFCIELHSHKHIWLLYLQTLPLSSTWNRTPPLLSLFNDLLLLSYTSASPCLYQSSAVHFLLSMEALCAQSSL